MLSLRGSNKQYESEENKKEANNRNLIDRVPNDFISGSVIKYLKAYFNQDKTIRI